MKEDSSPEIVAFAPGSGAILPGRSGGAVVCHAMSPTRLAIYWHQHQPFYKDLVTGVFRMPWVRLHATKDYYGMARLLEEADGAVKATINLVPSLIEQLQDYADGGARDTHLDLSSRPPDSLVPEERARALDLLFMANHETMVKPHERYGELYERRRFGRMKARHAVSEFGDGDLRDLQVWANLVWFHGTVLEEDEGLSALIEKGRDFTEGDKEYLLERQREVIAEVIPLHRRLMEAGVLEVTTTPFYHPILPLLVSMESAHVALPGTPLPEHRESLIADAREHLRRAVEQHEEVFGVKPFGLWPSEGSVSPEILPLVAEAGISWLASDEEVLANSDLGRSYHGEDLYRPWRVSSESGELSMVFRDHRLSDLVGFDYQKMDAEAAVHDFLARVRAVRRPEGREAPLVTVVLDGENAWEHYPGGGVPFLRALYREIGRATDIETVRIGSELLRSPPGDSIRRLHSGSWIHSNFAIWIGHEEDVRAWEYLFRVRKDLEELARETGDRDAEELAWKSLYVAEGSDWTWWYGDDHTSGIDDQFDELFRTHLANVYRAFGRRHPRFLDSPVPVPRPLDAGFEPEGTLRADLDGQKSSYFEWLTAARYRRSPGEGLAGSGGAMSRAARPVLDDIRFGFDRSRFLVRIDPVGDWRERLTARNGSDGPWRLLVRLDETPERVLEVPDLLAPTPKLLVDGREPPCGRWVGVKEIVEIGCPRDLLGLTPGIRSGFFVELRRGEVLIERLPGAETVRFLVPETNLARGRWPGETVSTGQLEDEGERMPELRKDPIIGRWVIIAEGRFDRPTDLKSAEVEEAPGDAPAEETPFCPFCPGNEDKTPPEIFAIREPGSQPDGEGWRVRVVPNKYPVLRVEGDLGKQAYGMYDRMRGIGAHEVFIECPDHLTSFTTLDDDHVADILRAYQVRLLDLRRDGRLLYGMLFKNVGKEGGASLEHTHSQLIVTPVIPRRVAEEMAGAKRFFEFRGRCVYCDILDQEMSLLERTVMTTERFAAVVPYASRFPFETWILPRRHVSHFENSSPEDLEELAFLLKRVLARIETTLESPPYNYMLHTSAFNSGPLEHYHWHIEIIPRVTRTAGFEWGTGFYINPVRPEDAAEALREAGKR